MMNIKCTNCNGSAKDHNTDETCEKCKGAGWSYIYIMSPYEYENNVEKKQPTIQSLPLFKKNK